MDTQSLQTFYFKRRKVNIRVTFGVDCASSFWVGASQGPPGRLTFCALRQQKRALKILRLLGFFGEDLDTSPERKKRKP